MAQDPVLQREMFNPRDRPARGSGITSTVDDGSSEMTREERLQIAQEMLAEAKMKQTPEYYFNTLAASDRPAMTRPVASSAPPPVMQQMPAAQQMAQMQAAGVRPVGMAHGGEVRHKYAGEDGSLVTAGGPLSYEELMAQYAESGNVDRRGSTMIAPGSSQYDPMGSFTGGEDILIPSVSSETRKLSTTPSASRRELTDIERGILSIKRPIEEPIVEEPIKETPKEEAPISLDKKQTELEQIKADRKAEKEKNFYLGLMQAGLAMMGGKSPDALQNIAQGGISGLQSYAGMEAESRKAEREEMAALRAQQQDEATAAYRERTLGLEREKMGQDSDTIRLYKALGGGDLNKGYALTQDDENLKAAVAVSRDSLASPEAKVAAEQYIMSKISPQGAATATGSRIIGVQ